MFFAVLFFMFSSSWWHFKVKWIWGALKNHDFPRGRYSQSSVTHYANENKACVIYKCLFWMAAKKKTKQNSTAELQTNLKILYKDRKCHSKNRFLKAKCPFVIWQHHTTLQSCGAELTCNVLPCCVVHFNWVMLDLGCVTIHTRLSLSCGVTHGLNFPVAFFFLCPAWQSSCVHRVMMLYNV